MAIPAGSKVFNKLDPVWMYHQIALDIASRKVTMFLLPSGHHRYTRGPMGLCSTNDELWFCSNTAIKYIPGCFKIVDDILVAAPMYEVLYQRLDPC